jgi:hypothetical protein
MRECEPYASQKMKIQTNKNTPVFPVLTTDDSDAPRLRSRVACSPNNPDIKRYVDDKLRFLVVTPAGGDGKRGSRAALREANINQQMDCIPNLVLLTLNKPFLSSDILNNSFNVSKTVPAAPRTRNCDRKYSKWGLRSFVDC